MKTNKHIFICFLLSIPLSGQPKLQKISMTQLMLEYKKFFGQYVLVQGIRAEAADDEFVLEALPTESKILQQYPEAKDWKPEDLFINIRVEDIHLMKKILRLPERTPILALLEVRESATYNKIIPVFVLQDYTEISVPIQSLPNNQQEMDTTSAEHLLQKRNYKRIKIRRR